MDLDRIESVVESIIFASAKPVSAKRLSEAFNDDVTEMEIMTTISNITTKYSSMNSGLSLVEAAGGWQIRTSIENSDYIRRSEGVKQLKFSPAALEVLSIIAYKQPVIKAEVDKIRGVDSARIIHTLMERGLVKINGKSDLPGKPLIYATTSNFLEFFGLYSLEDLPELDSLQELDDRDVKPLTTTERVSGLIDDEDKNENLVRIANELELHSLDEIKKNLKLDIDINQEKVDILFMDACRKFASQREAMIN